MPDNFVPYEPYHPHLGYTLLITGIAWVSVLSYCRMRLQSSPRERALLYGLAVGLPLFAEGGALLIFFLRPAPSTPLGAVLSRFHAEVVNNYPIDTFLEPTTQTLLLSMLALLALWSLTRLWVGQRQLQRLLVGARPLGASRHAPLAAAFNALGAGQAPPPPCLLLDSAVPLAFTAGLLRPRIYISTPLIELLAPDEVLAVLCHEWAHIQRHDTLYNSLIRLLRDLASFLPGSYPAWRLMIASQDEACDIVATRMTHEPLALARALLKLCAASEAQAVPAPLRASTNQFSSTRAIQSRIELMIRASDGMLGQQQGVIGAYTLAAALLLLAVLPALVGS